MSGGGFARGALAAALCGTGAGTLLATLDTLRLHVTHGPNLAFGTDRVAFLLAAYSSLTLVCVFLAGVSALSFRAMRPVAVRAARIPRSLMLAAPLVIAIIGLNAGIVARAPLALVIVFATVWGAAAFVISARFDPVHGAMGGLRGRLAAAAAAFLVVVGMTHADATLYVGLYPSQHTSLALIAAVAALWFVAEVLGMKPAGAVGLRVRPIRAGAVAPLGLAALSWVGLCSVGAEDVSQNARFLAYQAAPGTGHALNLLARLTDWDRDGVPALFGAGDCDNRDPNVYPGAVEIPDDGIDNDCLGGDLNDEARALFARFTTPDRPAAPPPGFAARHLVYVSIDALRHDRVFPLSPREGRDTVANLRRTLRDHIAFSRAYTPYPSTILGLYAMQASIHPSEIETSRYHQFEVPADDPRRTLAELLRDAGFHTGGFWFHHIFAPRLGIGRGFDRYWVAENTPEVVNRTRSGEETVDRALAWAEETLSAAPDARLFLWVHLYDPHDPYLTHPGFGYGERESDPDEDRYDAELAYSDVHMARLLDGLRALGVLGDAATWIFADHGEEFGDHGGRYHGTTLYDEQVRVPVGLLLPERVGAVGRARLVEAPASLIDVPATALDLLGLVALRPDTFRGRSLWSDIVTAGDAPGRPLAVFLECYRQDGSVLRGVVRWPWKLIHWRDQHFFELYNLERDPGERFNVYDFLPEERWPLEVLLGAWVAMELPPPDQR